MLRELLENASVVEIIATFVALGLIIATILCLVYIIFGGISFILSAGNEEKIKRAVHTIRFSIIGLFVSFIAFFIVRFMANLLDIPFELSFSNIVDLMREIFSALQ
jgi:4-amino-4-deoxy-L-arabinose transferase-like glycosyltransferase